MRNTKTNNNNIKMLLAAGLMLFLLPSSAIADSLIVEFENDPLFSESNFLPGSSVSRWARVQNNSDFTQDILVEAINITDSDKFGDVLDITILEGDTELFNDTLSKFFNSGEIFLSALGAGEETEYDFQVSFKYSSSNDYQESTLGLDILIGFRGDGSPLPPGSGGGGGGESTGGGGGGGYVIPPRGLVILDESTVVTSISTTTASISWATSHKSTSKVIYDTASGVFDFNNSPNYGYSFSTVEFDTPPETNGVTYHTVLLTSLTPGTAYYYRVISHASPPSIGVEKKFVTLGLGFFPEADDKKNEIFDGVGGEGNLERARYKTAEGGATGAPYESQRKASSRTDKKGGSGNAQEAGDGEAGASEGEDRELEPIEAENFSEASDSKGEELFLNSTASLARDLFGKRWLLIGFLIITLGCGVLAARRVLNRRAQN